MRCLIPLAATAAAVSVRIAAPCPANTVPWGDGTCEPFAVAKRDALKWLRKNAPPADVRNAATLFGTPGGVDGLDAGVAAVAANATLTAIHPGMRMLEDGAYLNLTLLYKGELSLEAVLPESLSPLDFSTVGYGVANLLHCNGQQEQAMALLARITNQSTFWAAFGYIAAEADLFRWR